MPDCGHLSPGHPVPVEEWFEPPCGRVKGVPVPNPATGHSLAGAEAVTGG